MRNLNYIPRIDDVQQGYAIPSKLEVKVKDLDGNGNNETILNYDGKSYLFRVDENNKPYFSEYEIKPTEIIPRTTETKIFDKKN